ncbi:MAG: hydroxyacid dehydrogenase [Anaerolineae bacterium]|nr:hydroxyacid dehydrogenase [Phycisphaerae bacterium]
MKALIVDKFQPSGINELKSIGVEVTYNPDVSADTLPELVAKEDPDVLIVRSTKVLPPVFEKAKRLTLVVRAGAGVDNIDVPAASARGISVANCPGKNSIAVAELVWALILATDRRIPDQTAELRAGKWNKKEYSKARGLFGRTLGVVGVGQIAKEVISRAHAFGMNVVAWSRSLDAAAAERLGVERVDSPIDVAKRSDVISVNIAATGETKKLINAEFCAALRPGAVLINSSRGTVIDEPALLKAIKEKNVRAGLDVFDGEPAAAGSEFKSELAANPNVTGTHHIGASTDQAQDAIATEAVRVVRVYKETGEVQNMVNRCAKSPATRLLVVRHRNRPGVLAHVIGEIGRAQINIEEMENVIYQGSEAACAKIRLDADLPESALKSIRSGSEHILSADLTAIE